MECNQYKDRCMCANRTPAAPVPASTGRDDIGWKMANWLFGLSVSELTPDSWRKTCAELSAAWHAASPVAARELDVEAERRAYKAWQDRTMGRTSTDGFEVWIAAKIDAWLPSTEAAPVSTEQAGDASRQTLMTEEQAEKWAWEQVKKDVGTDGWTVGDSCNYFGFFLWGWRYRAQYERQRATPERAAAPADLLTAVLNCYSPDDTISDYQDKIRGVFATARAAEGDGGDIFALMDVEDGQMVRIEVVGDRVPSGRYELRRTDQQASAQKGGSDER